MNCEEAIICVVSKDTRSGKHLSANLDGIGGHPYVVVDSVADLEQCKKERTVSLALIDRSLSCADFKSLLKLPEPCALATFGIAGPCLEHLQAVESSACYQLRHPAEKIDLERLFGHLSKQRTSPASLTSSRSAHLYRGLVGDSAAVVKLRGLIQKIATAKSTVLISGETGTGKEIVARNIHYYSPQCSGPFVPVNCSAIPPDLLESELFGHKKGAFTGALNDRVGRFAMAAGGTLFLDEIGDMTPGLQAKLLRVLEERVIERVGCNKPIKMTARLVAATHRDLEQRIEDGTFREDLFYRLNVVPVEVPSLRTRKEDIPELAHELSRRLQREQGIAIELTPAALEQLQKHDWPGNVRELANLVERLAVICSDGVADDCDLPPRYRKPGYSSDGADAQPEEILSHSLVTQQWPEDGIDLKDYLRSTEARLIRQALKQCGGTVAQAAQLLHVGRTTLVEKVRRLGLSESSGVPKQLP